MKHLLIFTLPLFLFISCGEIADTNEKAHAEVSSTLDTEEVGSPDSDNKRMLRHVVLFKFKESATPEDIAGIEAAFKDLPNKIPEIKGFEWGTNNSPEGLDKGFTHCFFLSFDDEAGRATYLPHPDHQAFGDLLGPHLEDVCVVDYWAD